MVITRETDYALRILRALLGGDLRTVGQIAQDELLPQAFAYKILKKLERAGLIEVTRGMATGERSDLSSCMDPQFQCTWRNCHGGCTAHRKLMEIQKKLDGELRSHSLKEILSEP